MIRACVLVAVTVLGCVDNPPPQNPSGPPGMTKSQQAPKQVRYCHEVSDTGSLFSHVECTTKQEEAERNEETERVLRRSSGGVYK